MILWRVTIRHSAHLQDDQPILPDPYSERFGLRADRIKAAERAHYFMSWAPPYCEAPGQSHIKKYMICKIGITGVGYMFLTENNIHRREMAVTLSDLATTIGMAPCTNGCMARILPPILSILFSVSKTNTLRLYSLH